MTDIDPNKIAAELFHKIFASTLGAVSSNVKDAVSKVLDAIRKNLSTYLCTTVAKCTILKTPIINRDTPTYLFDIYVHTKLKLKNRTTEDDEFIAELQTLRSVVVSGGAGSGKSMFMRYLFMSMCEKGLGRVVWRARTTTGLKRRELESISHGKSARLKTCL